jgi:ABC-type antimicrobial peptide transport system permease subunit
LAFSRRANDGRQVIVVTMATLVACALPAWRAVRVNPAISLTAE